MAHGIGAGMESKGLEERRQSLEEQFFRKENERHRDALKAKQDRDSAKAALHAAGVRDDILADQLVGLGVAPQSVAALELVPLVLVAWADGEVQEKEREAILRAAHGAGVPEGGPGSQLLHAWLSAPPPTTLEGTWTQYVRELCAQMTPQAKGKFCSELLGRTLQIAKSAGGFLGIGTVSAAEHDVIDRLTQAFSV
jgi:hypothetical protein